jgi:hypothetical protein
MGPIQTIERGQFRVAKSTVLLPPSHVHSFAVLGVDGGVDVLLPPGLPPQPDVSRAIETSSVEAIFPCNRIFGHLLSKRNVFVEHRLALIPTIVGMRAKF